VLSAGILDGDPHALDVGTPLHGRHRGWLLDGVQPVEASRVSRPG
jgi:hypothetical protein